MAGAIIQAVKIHGFTDDKQTIGNRYDGIHMNKQGRQ